MTQWNLAPLYVLTSAQILQFAGVIPLGFLLTGDQQSQIATLYICQVLTGLGVGASTVSSMLLLKLMVPPESFGKGVSQAIININ
jgi:nitrate/nitrite transporter NarK